MHFDTATTLISICTIVGLLGLQTLFFWARDFKSRWLGWFGFAFLLGTLSTLVYLIPIHGHEFLLLGVGNAVRILAFVFLWHGSREFARRPSEQLTGLFVVAAWLALSSVPAFLDSIPLRYGLVSLCIALFCGLAARELWRIRAENLPSLIPAALTYASYGLFAVLRIVAAAFFYLPGEDGHPVHGVWIVWLSLVTAVHATFIVTLTLSLTRERRESEERRQAMSDPLTGLWNRRAYADEARRIAHRRGRNQHPTSVLVLDLDWFKAINDEHGHEAGDMVLQRFADVARADTRTGDLLYRMGGEEFCFILPETGLDEALQVAERIRRRFEETPVHFAGKAIRTTVSTGVATTDQSAFDLDLLLGAGDAAVYRAKGLGRNRTVVADMRLTPSCSIDEAAAA